MAPKAIGSAVRLASLPPAKYVASAQRSRSSDTFSTSEPPTPSLNPRWLSDVKRRIGKCITFGLPPEQVQEAGRILQGIVRDWRELLAGSEGFLTDRTRVGLFRHRVVWGEQDSMVWTSMAYLK